MRYSRISSLGLHVQFRKISLNQWLSLHYTLVLVGVLKSTTKWVLDTCNLVPVSVICVVAIPQHDPGHGLQAVEVKRESDVVLNKSEPVDVPAYVTSRV